MATATLAGLKLTAAQKSTSINPVQQRRNKMSKRLWEQIQLAKAQAEGGQFTPSKFRSVVDSETGLRKSVEVPKRVKAWWFTADNGKTAIAVRYGARSLELAKGKYAVEIASAADLIPTLELIKTAIEAGELDTQLEATAGNVRSSFHRWFVVQNDMRRYELWVRLSPTQTTHTIIYASNAIDAQLLGEAQFGKGKVLNWRELTD